MGKLRNFQILSYYNSDYSSIMSEGIIGKVANYIHFAIANQSKSISQNEKTRILEIGAFEQQHIKFEKQGKRIYVQSDVLFPNSEKVIQPYVNCDGHQLPFKDNTFDKIIMTCVAPHVTDIEIFLKEVLRVVKNGGKILLYLPHEYSLLLRFAQKISTRRLQKKKGLNGYLLHYREHINSYHRIFYELKEISPSIKIIRYPVRFAPWEFTLFSIAIITKN